MLIIVDKKIPEEAKARLKHYGELLELETNGITYNAISGHPDIFITKALDKWIIAPNTPNYVKDILREREIDFVEGEEAVDEKYPQSSKYNVVCTSTHLIHNFRNTDSIITRKCEDLDLIHVDQGYTRCNLIPLTNDAFISSDKGISKVLDRYGIENIYVNPKGIELPGFTHGFFGGCCGIFDQKLFVIGKIDHLENAKEFREFITSKNIEIIELYNGNLFDGGSILFL
tara:strand:+ start:345 stop:1031 length:687 start_codon:yes stop_codon:yes gene_type:complete